jgi:Holliday junction resolvase
MMRYRIAILEVFLSTQGFASIRLPAQGMTHTLIDILGRQYNYCLGNLRSAIK